MKNYYEILQVNSKASKEIIDKAYNVLLKQYNPNIQKSEIEKMRSEQIIKDLNEAYYVLSDVFLREQYDRELQQENLRNMNQAYDEYEKNNYKYNNMRDTNQNRISKRKKKKEKSVKGIEENTEYNEGYEVGTFSAILALIDKIFSNKPDVGKIKNAKKNDIIIFLISILIVVIICVILWFIPFTNGFIRSLLFMD